MNKLTNYFILLTILISPAFVNGQTVSFIDGKQILCANETVTYKVQVTGYSCPFRFQYNWYTIGNGTATVVGGGGMWDDYVTYSFSNNVSSRVVTVSVSCGANSVGS